ncbi:MAG: hypothetical protein IM507_21080, partial [Microcystis sp. M20BS1]
TAGIYVHPTTWAFISYYFMGGSQPPTLSEADIAETRDAVIISLKAHLKDEEMSRRTSLVASGDYDDWWSSLAGAIGNFNYRILAVGPDTIKVECRDTWNFNPNSYYMKLPCPPRLASILSSMAKKIGIEVSYNEGQLTVCEEQLVKLNPGRAFTTVWEIEVPTAEVVPEWATYWEVGTWNEGNYAFIRPLKYVPLPLCRYQRGKGVYVERDYHPDIDYVSMLEAGWAPSVDLPE